MLLLGNWWLICLKSRSPNQLAVVTGVISQAEKRGSSVAAGFAMNQLLGNGCEPLTEMRHLMWRASRHQTNNGLICLANEGSLVLGTYYLTAMSPLTTFGHLRQQIFFNFYTSGTTDIQNAPERQTDVRVFLFGC